MNFLSNHGNTIRHYHPVWSIELIPPVLRKKSVIKKLEKNIDLVFFWEPWRPQHNHAGPSMVVTTKKRPEWRRFRLVPPWWPSNVLSRHWPLKLIKIIAQLIATAIDLKSLYVSTWVWIWLVSLMETVKSSIGWLAWEKEIKDSMGGKYKLVSWTQMQFELKA